MKYSKLYLCIYIYLDNTINNTKYRLVKLDFYECKAFCMCIINVIKDKDIKCTIDENVQ